MANIVGRIHVESRGYDVIRIDETWLSQMEGTNPGESEQMDDIVFETETDPADATMDRPTDRRTKALLLQARKALAESDFDAATNLVAALLKIDPGNAAGNAFVEKLRVHRCSNARKRLNSRDDDVLDEIDAIHALYPTDTLARRLKARALIARREHGSARDILGDLITHHEASADDFVQYARVCRSTHDVEAAIGACFDALALQPEAPAALALMERLLPPRE